MSISVHQAAPKFTLESDAGTQVSLESFLGKKVVLFFYPKDDTPGCTLESCGFRDHYDEFKKHNTEIIGISRDSVSSHKRFKDKHDLPFPLLADINSEVSKAYDVLSEDAVLGFSRTTFLIDEQGCIDTMWRNVSVGGHIAAVLKAIS